MKSRYEYLEKYSIPTRLDKEYHGTIWAHMTEDGEAELYIQVSRDKECPVWVPYGQFLAKAFKTHVEEELFITRCLRLYENDYTHPKTIVNRIIYYE